MATRQTVRKARPFLIRGTLLMTVLVVVVVLPAFTLAPVTPDWVPAPLQLWAYDMRLIIGRPVTTLTSLKEAVVHDTAVTFAHTGERVAIVNGDITLAGTVYTPDVLPATGSPGILLLHGSTPQGRKLGLYRMMGQALADEGYVVLTIDQRGYGQSSNPPDVADPQSFAFVDDVGAAMAYLAALPQVDADDLYLIGHSFGGDVALTAVADSDTLFDKVVVIGPGRNFMTRGGTPDTPEFDYFRRREMRYMFLWQGIPAETFSAYRTTLPLENHLDYLATPDHLPLLFIDGALESADDRAFLADVYTEMAGAGAYVTLPDADHYANVANVGPLIVYDEDAVTALITIIADFLRTDA